MFIVQIFDIRAQHPTLFGHLPATLDEVKHHLAGEQSALRGMSLSSLKPSLKEDAAFLGEIQIIHEMLEAVSTIQTPSLISISAYV